MKYIKANRVEDGLKILGVGKFENFKEDIHNLLMRIANTLKKEGFTEKDIAHSLANYLSKY